MRGVFISYRRDDSLDVTGRLYDALCRRYGKHRVFKDVDSIPPAADFRQVLQDAIARAKVMVVVIGDQWADVENPDGARRLEEPDDFVRLEIEAALAAGIPILPVTLGNTSLPDADELPESLRELVSKQAARVRPDPDFRRDMDILCRALRPYIWSTRRILWLVFAVVAALSALILWRALPSPSLSVDSSLPEARSSTEELESMDRTTPSPAVAEIRLSEYYRGLEGLEGDGLKTALSRLTRRDHRLISYRDSWDHTANIYADPFEPDKLRVFYDDKMVPKERSSELQWNREHVWPKSRGFNRSEVAKADLFNIVPADPRQNAERSNKLFTDTETDGMFLIEPSRHGDIRGDLARILFYMAVRYEGVSNEPDLELVEDPLSSRSAFGPLSLLLRWHSEDGISIAEKERNDRVYEIQGNRNPFIDHPHLAGLIWGAPATP